MKLAPGQIAQDDKIVGSCTANHTQRGGSIISGMLLQSLTTACALTGLRVCSPVVMQATSLTDNPSWPKIQSLLDDALPVFTVANSEGKPLQFQVGGEPMAIFYADVDAAKSATETASAQIDCDMVPVGLGAAYSMACEGKATVVPGVAELTAAGMPAGVSPVGQELPLYACLQMSKETEAGDSVMPVFMSVQDCEAALKDAREADPGLEIVPLSLPGIVKHLSALEDDKPAFEFVAPASSREHIKTCVGFVDGQFVYARLVDNDSE